MDNSKKKDVNWSSTADGELDSSVWFGAILRYFWHLGHRKFNTFYNSKERLKNAIIGNLLKIVFLISIVVFVYFMCQ